MKKLVQKVCDWYVGKNRWWFPAVVGLLYTIPFAPFNHELHPALFAFPLFVFIILIPLFAFAVQQPLKRAVLHTYLFSFTASLTQFYWLTNVVAEGLYHLVLLGMMVTAAIVGLFYLALGMGFRFIREQYPRWYIAVYPAFFILIEWLRSVGEIAFPWNHIGYAFISLLPIAQTASITGVYGLSLFAVVGNILIFELLESYNKSWVIAQKWIHIAVFALMMALLAGWGAHRMQQHAQVGEPVRAAMIQPNIDQFNWGNNSMDTSLAVTESLLVEASGHNPDFYVLSESALFCYVERRRYVRLKVRDWVDTLQRPLIFGSLHLERNETKNLGYDVYNTAFFADSGTKQFQRYYKMRLVPGSEAMPFQGAFPILSRLNLGSADFSRGTDPTIFAIDDQVRAGPFICYEIIFPDLVRERVLHGANVLINITNDGWFGKSTAPYQHAAMARMRTIENGVPLIRTANSGISMAVDACGRMLGKTGLYERSIEIASVKPGTGRTLYTRFGDWPLQASLALVIIALIGVAGRKLTFRKESGGATGKEEPVEHSAAQESCRTQSSRN